MKKEVSCDRNNLRDISGDRVQEWEAQEEGFAIIVLQLCCSSELIALMDN